MTYTTPCRIISKYGLAIVNVSSHGEGALVNDGSVAIQHQHATRYFEVRTGLAHWGASSAWIELTSTSAITHKRHSFCHWAALANENSGHVVYSCSYERAAADTYITSLLPTGHPLLQFSDKTATSLWPRSEKSAFVPNHITPFILQRGSTDSSQQKKRDINDTPPNILVIYWQSKRTLLICPFQTAPFFKQHIQKCRRNPWWTKDVGCRGLKWWFIRNKVYDCWPVVYSECPVAKAMTRRVDRISEVASYKQTHVMCFWAFFQIDTI